MLTHKHTLVTDFSSRSLSGRRILSSHFTSDPVDICRALQHTWIDKKMFSPILFVIAMLHCHSSPSFKDSVSTDGHMKNGRVL